MCMCTPAKPSLWRSPTITAKALDGAATAVGCRSKVNPGCRVSHSLYYSDLKKSPVVCRPACTPMRHGSGSQDAQLWNGLPHSQID